MYSVWTRANSVFFTALTALAIMSTLTTLSTYFHEAKPEVRILQMNKITSLRNYRDNTDRATFTFDLDADLSTVFNWNVKQIFVYIIAEYESKSNQKNQVVIWDKIIQKKEDAKKIQYIDEITKYMLADQYDELRDAQVTLSLEWDIMPVCGQLFVNKGGNSSFVLPSQYQGKPPQRS